MSNEFVTFGNCRALVPNTIPEPSPIKLKNPISCNLRVDSSIKFNFFICSKNIEKDLGWSTMFKENIINDKSYFFTIYQENLISSHLMEIARIFQNIIVKHWPNPKSQ